MSVPTFAGTVLPDCFVGVPYLAALPIATVLSQNVTAVSVQATSLAPPGLVFSANGVISGTVQLTSGQSTTSQLDGAYTFLLKITDAATQTASSTITMNVHYLTADQDLSVAGQAAIRAGEEIDNLSGNAGVNVFPTAPAVPTDVG